MGLVELLQCVGNDNIEFQKLHDCLTSVKEKKRDKCTELSFLTQAITPNDVSMGTGKIGLVVWVDQDVMSKAYDEAAKLAISSYDANQDLITKQAEQIKMLREALEMFRPEIYYNQIGEEVNAGGNFTIYSDGVADNEAMQKVHEALEATKGKV